MSDIPPKWAMDRARELAGLNRCLIGDAQVHYAFAAYIAQHESPPVDPLLIEAREAAATAAGARPWSSFCRDGSYDSTHAVQAALAGVKRGMELGRERAK